MLHTRNFMHTQTLKNEREHWSEPINNPCKDLNSFKSCTLMFVCCKQDVALKELWDTMIAWYMESGLTRIIFTKEMVVEQLKRLKTDKSPGIDELHPKFLHEVREEIGEVLAQI